MNINKLVEQLKDVPQAKLIDYAKNPNSLVPQFLALAEIQRRQKVMRATPAEAPTASVAEEIMDQESPRMSGVAQLPTRAMFTEEGMAGGGIVAFAEGGDAEEEYEEALEKAKRSRMQGLQAALAEAGGYFKNPLANIENRPTRAQRMAVEETAAPAPTRKGSHKYEDIVLSEAQRQGLDPNLARHVLYKETGNLANPETAKSKAGALGVMQLMPRTAKELGVDPLNPEDNIRGGVMYLRKMMDRYNDPILAAAAYNAGPGRVDRALKGEGLGALPRETRMYITGLAEGGEVKRYQVGGELDGFGTPDYELDELRRQEALRKRRAEEETARQEFLRGAAPQLAKKEPVAPATTAATAPVVTLPRQDEGSPYIDGVPPSAPTAPVTATPAPAAPKVATSQSYFDMLMKNIDDQAAEAKKSGDMNKYLALMQAGFGMMASTSPYALTGVGQGAMTGLGTYAGLEKERMGQERALTGARLGLAKAKASQEEAEATREALSEYRKSETGRKADEGKTREAAMFRDDLRLYQEMRAKRIENKYKLNPMFGTDPKLQAQYQAELDAIYSDPQYIQLAKRAGIPIPTASTTSGGGWSIKQKQ